MLVDVNTLYKAGIPLPLHKVPDYANSWPSTSENKKFITSFIENLEEEFEKGTNLVLINERDTLLRQRMASWIAQQVMDQQNYFYRHSPDYFKHSRGVFMEFADGTTVEQGRGAVGVPFTTKWRKVDIYLRDKKGMDRDDDQDFEEWCLIPDYFFLIELGEEAPNRYVEAMIRELFDIRMGKGLPMVITLTKSLKEVEVYSTIRGYVEEYFKAVKL